jgi:hypothetical protein
MVDVIAVMRAGGILRPEITRDAATRAGLELPSACAMIMGETSGGRMIYGRDTRTTAGIYSPGGPVTPQNYLAFRAAQRAGRIPRNGVGDAQLTSEEFIARAEQLGGPTGPADPFTNQLAGFIGLAERQKSRGLQDGFRSYNGSGPLAQKYGREKMGDRNVWAARLGVPGQARPASIPPGPDALPELTHGMRGDSRVASLQRFLNAYRWVPALPLLPVTGNYLDQTAAVLASAQVQMGITGGDGRNTGPQTRRGLWERGWRG